MGSLSPREDEVERDWERVDLLGAAARLGHEPSLDALARMMTQDGEASDEAAIALVRCGDDRCHHLIQNVASGVRFPALEALADYGGEPTRTALEIAIDDRDQEIRLAARKLLAARCK